MGLNAMKKRLKGMLMCSIMLVTLLPITAIASAIGAGTEPVTNGIFDHTIVRGFALRLGMDATGRTTHLFAIRLHYLTISVSGEHNVGVIRMRPVDIPTKLVGYHGHVYMSGSFRGSIDI